MQRSVASWGSFLTAPNTETCFLYNLQKWLTKYLKYSKSVTFTSRQKLRHGDLCVCGLKARLLQRTPLKTTCRLELPERRSMTAQGPSPGEAGHPCAWQTTSASMIQSLFNYWWSKPTRVERLTLRNTCIVSHHGVSQGRCMWQLLTATSYNKAVWNCPLLWNRSPTHLEVPEGSLQTRLLPQGLCRLGDPGARLSGAARIES